MSTDRQNKAMDAEPPTTRFELDDRPRRPGHRCRYPKETMSVLRDQLESVLQPGMYIPDELTSLYDWIETRHLYIDNDDGRIGFLFPEEELKRGWTKTERPGGTNIEFAASGNVNVHYWFGHNREDVVNRLCVFAQTGAEGSEAALWIDDQGKQRIVHMGSGSGSILSCVLADNALDFLRLLAIGYDEICWDECFPYPPNHPESRMEFIVHPNIDFQAWLTTHFKTTIPQTALEIVRHPAKIGDTESPDDFNRWVEQNVG